MSTETRADTTKMMFDSLETLYRQGQSLLMDADRVMDERGWEPRGTDGPAEFSRALSLPERWYARWAVRFYWRALREGQEAAIARIFYVGIHFASDDDITIEEPSVSAGRLSYGSPMSVKQADHSYEYWMCKYWWYLTNPHQSREGWRQGGQSPDVENLKRTEAFAVPLYDITSRDKLEMLVIDPLLSDTE